MRSINKNRPDPTNRNRAEWAALAVRRFAEITGSDLYEEAIMDLLVDLRHLCSRESLDWEYILHKANLHYREEVLGARDGDS